MSEASASNATINATSNPGAAVGGNGRNEEEVDYIEAGRKILDDTEEKRNALQDDMQKIIEALGSLDRSMIWTHPTTKAKLFVGNSRAATTRSILDEINVKRIVCCQDDDATLSFEADPRFRYLHLTIRKWNAEKNEKFCALDYLGVLFKFVSEETDAGHNVLIHSLAGAHRAGTAGVACLMYFDKLNRDTAVALAKETRRVIDPIGSFPELLSILESELKIQSQTQTSAAEVGAHSVRTETAAGSHVVTHVTTNIAVAKAPGGVAGAETTSAPPVGEEPQQDREEVVRNSMPPADPDADDAASIKDTSKLASSLPALEKELETLWSSGIQDKTRWADKRNCHAILPSGRLWLGGGSVPQLPADITHVVTLWDEGRTDAPEWEVQEEQKTIRVADDFDAPIQVHLDGAVAFITSALRKKGRVYVHCNMGRSRSATVVTAFLMRYFRVSLRCAYLFLMERRHCSALNLGFFARLVEFEAKHHLNSSNAKYSVTLLDYWRITVLHLEHRDNLECRHASNSEVAEYWPLNPVNQGGMRGLPKLVHGLHFVCKNLQTKSSQARETMELMGTLAAAHRRKLRRQTS